MEDDFQYRLYEWSMNWWYTLTDKTRAYLQEKYGVRYDNHDGVRYIYKKEKNID